MSQNRSVRRGTTLCAVSPCAKSEAESDPDRIDELLRETDPAVRRGLSRNPSVPMTSLALLAEEFPSDVLSNPTLHFAFAADWGTICSWPTSSLIALVRAANADPAFLAQLLQTFTIGSRNSWSVRRIQPADRLELLDALLAKANMPSSALRSFLSQWGPADTSERWNDPQLEAAAMHPALQPGEPSFQDALASVTSCLRRGGFRHDDSRGLALAVRNPTEACRAVVRGLGDVTRIRASLGIGDAGSPIFDDFLKDRSEDYPGPMLTAEPGILLRDTATADVGPADLQEHRQWVAAPLAKRRAAALVSRFATIAELEAALQSDRPTVRAAATEGLRRRSLVVGDSSAEPSDIARIAVIIRWPELKGARLTEVIRVMAIATKSELGPTQHAIATASCIAALARDDLSDADVEILATHVPDVVGRCAHSTREALRLVIRRDKFVSRRLQASQHPNADPADVSWLRSPEGLLEALAGEWLSSRALGKADAFELASGTHGGRVGNTSRILALALNECPADLLVLRANSGCWIERLLVAAHAATPARIRDRLSEDPCWAVRIVAKETVHASPASLPPRRGRRAEAQSQRAKESAQLRPLMSAIRRRLSSPDWAVVSGCIRDIVAAGNAEVLRVMNRGVSSVVTESAKGGHSLWLTIDDEAEISRRVKRCFRDEAALALVNAQLGPRAPLKMDASWSRTLEKSLRDVDGLPSLEHYEPGFNLRLDGCGASRGKRTIPAVAGLEGVVGIEFVEQPSGPEFLAAARNVIELRGEIPHLPRMESVRRVEGTLETSQAHPSPVSAVASLPHLEHLQLSLKGTVLGGAPFAYSPSMHPILRDLRFAASTLSGRYSVRLTGNGPHANLKHIELWGGTVTAEPSLTLPNVAKAKFGRCSLSHGLHLTAPNIKELCIDECDRVPQELLGLDGLQSLSICGDIGLHRLQVAPNGLEVVDIRGNNDIQVIERVLPHDRLERIGLRGCGALRTIVLGERMDRLKSIAAERCASLSSVLLPKSCPLLERVSITRCAAIRSADAIFSGLPSSTPIRVVSLASCEALENIDILANFPSLQDVDLTGCKSLRSVAALRSLGPGLRLKMRGAARAEGEADLGSGVVSRR